MKPRTDPPPAPRPFVQELLLELARSTVSLLAHHAGKALREHLAARRAAPPPPKGTPCG